MVLEFICIGTNVCFHYVHPQMAFTWRFSPGCISKTFLQWQQLYFAVYIRRLQTVYFCIGIVYYFVLFFPIVYNCIPSIPFYCMEDVTATASKPLEGQGLQDVCTEQSHHTISQTNKQTKTKHTNKQTNKGQGLQAVCTEQSPHIYNITDISSKF